MTLGFTLLRNLAIVCRISLWRIEWGRAPLVAVILLQFLLLLLLLFIYCTYVALYFVQWQLKFLMFFSDFFITFLPFLWTTANLWWHLLLRYILWLPTKYHRWIPLWRSNHRHTCLIHIMLMMHSQQVILLFSLLLLPFLHLQRLLQIVGFLQLFQGNLEFLHNLHVFTLE